MKNRFVGGRLKVVHSEHLDAHFRVVIQKAAGGYDYLTYKDGVLCNPVAGERGITLETAFLYLKGARRAARGSRGTEIKGPWIRVYLSTEALAQVQRLRALPAKLLRRLGARIRGALRLKGRRP